MKSKLLGVFDDFKLEVGESITEGTAEFIAYEYEDTSWSALDNLRAMRDGGYIMKMYPGKYIKLILNGRMMMSDTNMEKLSNEDFVKAANGNVLIAGMGIGMLQKNLMPKIISGEISSITIVENNRDVITVVDELFRHVLVDVVHEDIFEYKTKDKFDSIYFDIWPTIGTDNLEDIKKLHNIFKHRVNRGNPNCFMNSWMKEYLQKMKTRERSYAW